MYCFKIKNLEYKNILNIKELTIPKNKVTIISGPSGSGKSTLLKLLTSKDYNYSGNIELLGKSIKHRQVTENFKNMVCLGQESVLLSNTIQEEFKTLEHLLNIKYDENKIKNLLNLLNLDYSLEQSTKNLSGGEKQRLYLARTLFINKDIIIMDEPTSALDKSNTKLIIDKLHEYSTNKNKTIIMVTHNDNIIQDERFNHINLGAYNEYN